MILVIAGTNRKNSKTALVAQQINTLLEARQQEYKYINLENLPPDFMYSHFNGQINDEFQEIITGYVQPATKFLLVMPEYNGAFPGVLKSFFDCIHPRFFNGKQAALIGVSSGHTGGARGLDMFTLILNYLKVNVHWNKPKLSNIEEHLIEGNLEKEYLLRLESLINEFA